jgi:16S rRNA (cytidine1402-2'-O)-methyltransferase
MRAGPMKPSGEGARGELFVVATPIGNLEDITLRAIRVLGEVDLVACEDTRHTAHLLAAHGIRKPTISYFEHNEERRAAELVERLRAGAKIALVSDAGTPTISDPGYRLVRGAIEAGCRVVAIPGASAVTAALSIAGLPTDRFAFEGFVPARAAARTAAFAALVSEPRTMVFFEAARRLDDTLAAMAAGFGVDRPAAIVREISKTFEETIRGTLGELRDQLSRRELKGEVVAIVQGAPVSAAKRDVVGERMTVEMLTDAGLGLKQASDLIARLTGRSRREIYQAALRRGGRGRDGFESDGS